MNNWGIKEKKNRESFEHNPPRPSIYIHVHVIYIERYNAHVIYIERYNVHVIYIERYMYMIVQCMCTYK